MPCRPSSPSPHSPYAESDEQQTWTRGVCGCLHTLRRLAASALDGGASVELRLLGAERVERPEQPVPARRRVLRNPDLDGEPLALTRGDRLRGGAVEHVDLDLARGHELLDVRRAAVEANRLVRRVLQHDDEAEHLAASGV